MNEPSLKRLAWLYGCAPKGTAQEEQARTRLVLAVRAEGRSIEDDLGDSEPCQCVVCEQWRNLTVGGANG